MLYWSVHNVYEILLSGLPQSSLLNLQKLASFQSNIRKRP